MFSILLILFTVFVVEVQYNPRLELTTEKDLLLFFNYKNKREYFFLTNIKL